MAFVRAMYKKETENDKQGNDMGNRTLCPYRNFSQAIKLHIKHSKTEIFCMFVISNNQSLISQILKVVGPLGEKFKFFSPLGFKIQSNLIWKLQESSSTQSEL